MGDALARDPRVAGLSFTGSTSVGLGLQDILNARRARVQLEMGGKNGVLVLDDARNAAQVVAARGVRPDRAGLHGDVPRVRHTRNTAMRSSMRWSRKLLGTFRVTVRRTRPAWARW